jgi:hypothetical protein
MPTIQTVPNKKGGQTIQTIPNRKTKTLTKTLSDSSTITEIVLETTEIPVEPIISSPQPQNSVNIWFSKNEKTIIGISCGILFLMIVTSIIFQIKRKKSKKRAEQEQVIFSPKTPKTPETPGGRLRRNAIRNEIR